MIEYLKDSLGISCVEIYLLALFRAAGVPCKTLLRNSFLPLNRAVSDFLTGESQFAAYTGLERLQTLAANDGMAETSYLRGVGAQPFACYICRVNPGYKANFAPWRDDHFLLQYLGEYYDCYPPSKISLDERFLHGDRIGVNILRKTPAVTEADACRMLKEKIVQEPFRPVEFTLLAENLIRIRDAMMIFKLSRRRVNALLANPCIDEVVSVTNRLIAKIEAFRLRKNIGAYQQELNEINRLENSWISALKDETKNRSVL